MLVFISIMGEDEDFYGISEHRLNEQGVFCKDLTGVWSSDQFWSSAFFPSGDCLTAL